MRIQIALISALLFSVSGVYASAWIEPGDRQTRFHTQYLHDRNLLESPLLTWPMPWLRVGSIASTDLKVSSSEEMWSAAHLRHESRFHDSGLTTQLLAKLSSSTVPSDFGSRALPGHTFAYGLDLTGAHFAFTADVSINVEGSREHHNVDQLNLSLLHQNWVFSIGKLKQWWGPSLLSSLLMSNNAEAIPALAVTRARARRAKLIGPWSVQAFVSRLESDRYISRPLYSGFRLELRPLSSLDLALSRVAIWGGDGRPEGLSTFEDLLLGNDNSTDNNAKTSREPGNQLGSIDWRWHWAFAEANLALYGQHVGEDESGGLPSRMIHQVGIETYFSANNWRHRIGLETRNTVASGDMGNYAYEHSIYRDGYRYKNVAIGTVEDRGVRMVALSADHYSSAGSELTWRVSRYSRQSDSAPFTVNDGKTLSMMQVSYGKLMGAFKSTISFTLANSTAEVFNRAFVKPGMAVQLEYRGG